MVCLFWFTVSRGIYFDEANNNNNNNNVCCSCCWCVYSMRSAICSLLLYWLCEKRVYQYFILNILLESIAPFNEDFPWKSDQNYVIQIRTLFIFLWTNNLCTICVRFSENMAFLLTAWMLTSVNLRSKMPTTTTTTRATIKYENERAWTHLSSTSSEWNFASTFFNIFIAMICIVAYIHTKI